jgi:hypothetical protein
VEVRLITLQIGVLEPETLQVQGLTITLSL